MPKRSVIIICYLLQTLYNMGSLKVFFFSMADASLVLNIDVSICHQDVQTPETVQTAVMKRLRSFSIFLQDPLHTPLG